MFISTDEPEESADCSFNTSYVNVYPRASREPEMFLSRFNTSYVNVYPRKLYDKSFYQGVSIHPMLMFIGSSGAGSIESGNVFQYILC